MNTSLVLCIERRPKGLGEDMRSPQLNGGERKVYVSVSSVPSEIMIETARSSHSRIPQLITSTSTLYNDFPPLSARTF